MLNFGSEIETLHFSEIETRHGKVHLVDKNIFQAVEFADTNGKSDGKPVAVRLNFFHRYGKRCFSGQITYKMAFILS